MDFNSLQYSLHATHSRLAVRDNRIEDHYSLIEKAGKGSYGVVWKAKKLGGSDETFAIKQVNKHRVGAKGLKEIMGEVETMSLLSHPNIVRLDETYQDSNDLWIVMEFMSGGELHQLLKKQCLNEVVARQMITQLITAVEYIHDKGIVHRDIKPSNCLLSQSGSTVKISDFGFAVLAGANQCLSTYCGTVAFMAPEILLKKHYGKPVDMWAIGIMTYLLILGRHPFAGDTTAALTRAICRKRCNWDRERLQESPLLRDFVARLLTLDANKRLTAKEALRHPWIKAGMEANIASPISSGSVSNQRTTKPAHVRLRAVVIVVIASHRMRYLQQCARLAKSGFLCFPLLRDYRYLVTGVYHTYTQSIMCANMFASKPAAILELLPMIESCDDLAQLDLSGNHIENLSILQRLLKAVSKHRSLRVLNLSHNPLPSIADRGLLRLARNPLSQIKQLVLDDTGVSVDVMASINVLLAEKANKHVADLSVYKVGKSNSLLKSVSTHDVSSISRSYMKGWNMRTSRNSGPSLGNFTHLPPLSHPVNNKSSRRK